MFSKKAIFIACLTLALTACKQQLPKTLDSPAVFGTVQSLKQQDKQKVLIYQDGQDPYSQRWGLATTYAITIDGKQYLASWDDAEKFKGLKVGDKVNLHPANFILCQGEMDITPDCYRLMHIYKSDRRINPLIIAH